MQYSKQSEKTSIVKNQKRTCSKCKFDNHSAAMYCEICFYPLNLSTSFSKLPQAKQSSAPVTKSSNFLTELRKPSVISGLAVLCLAIALWINYFASRKPRYLSSAADDIALYDSMSQVRNVPQGLFSYGGALYFASLVAHGINDVMMQNHPGFDLRYTKPINQDRSYSNGIKMLLDGELSFAFNGRSLADEEYSQASLRDISLLQVPIAIDGVVFFGNNSLTVENLSLDRVRDIFTGKISNWKQLGGEDLPIVPVLLTPENIEILGLENTNDIPQITQYVSNYTLALRKVIATPGAISFASASLVQNQQMIKIFNLAAENSTNYVNPIVAGQPNLKVFKDGSYPLTRRLFIVIRQDGTPDRLAGRAYIQMLLSNQGQEIVEKSGFVPLYGK
jgi:phosphate transport system substrate-binding protein